MGENCDGCGGTWCPPPAPSPPLTDLCDDTNTNLNMRLDKLLNNNLDGKGPDNTTEKSIRFGEVIVKDGEALDLVVTNENPYAGDSRNGKWHDHPMDASMWLRTMLWMS